MIFSQDTVNANANPIKIVLSTISPTAIAIMDLCPISPSFELFFKMVVNLALIKLPTRQDINDEINILGVCEKINAKLSCPAQQLAAGNNNPTVETKTNNRLHSTPKIIVFCAVDSP